MFQENGEPQDTVVSPDVLRNAPNGAMGNLVLPCSVSGSPTPAIAWFREGTRIEDEMVTDDGTLVLNLSEGVEASRNGTLYYCLATNTIGPSEQPFMAVLRSRDVTVSTTCESQHACTDYVNQPPLFPPVFDGFESTTPRLQEVLTAVGGAVTFRCDHLEGNPPPVIQWYADNLLVNPIPRNNEILIEEEGRYLFIRRLTSVQQQQQYHCEATNPLLNTMFRSPITYMPVAAPSDTFVVHKILGTSYALVNEEIRALYGAVAVDSMGRWNNIVIDCEGDDLTIIVAGGLLLRVSPITMPTNDDGLIVSCTVQTIDGRFKFPELILIVGGKF